VKSAALLSILHLFFGNGNAAVRSIVDYISNVALLALQLVPSVRVRADQPWNTYKDFSFTRSVDPAHTEIHTARGLGR